MIMMMINLKCGRKRIEVRSSGFYSTSSGNSSPSFRNNQDLDHWRWDRQVPKYRQGITTARCVISQMSAVRINFAAEPRSHVRKGKCMSRFGCKYYEHPSKFWQKIWSINSVQEAITACAKGFVSVQKPSCTSLGRNTGYPQLHQLPRSLYLVRDADSVVRRT